MIVQYKLLERLVTTGELIFRPDGRLVDQVDRMRRLSSNSGQVMHPADIRLRESLAFVKFVDPTEQRTILGFERSAHRPLPPGRLCGSDVGGTDRRTTWRSDAPDQQLAVD